MCLFSVNWGYKDSGGYGVGGGFLLFSEMGRRVGDYMVIFKWFYKCMFVRNYYIIIIDRGFVNSGDFCFGLWVWVFD